MEQRTCNIILCCKECGKGKTRKERIINYMSKECDCEPNDYNDETLSEILNEAVRDYISSCDSPSKFISVLLEKITHYYYSPFLRDTNFTPIDAIISTFCTVNVKNKVCDTWVYVNGFTEKLIETGHETLGGLKNEVTSTK